MRIQSWETRGKKRRCSFGAITKSCLEGKRKRLREKDNLLFPRSTGKKISIVTRTLPLLVLLLFLQADLYFVQATHEKYSAMNHVSKRSLAFVAGRNSRRSYASMPFSSLTSSQPSSQTLPTAPIIRMGKMETNFLPNRQQHDNSFRTRNRLYSSSRSNGDVNSENTSQNLRSILEEYRSEQSKSLKKSPSVLLPDKVLDGICEMDPLPSTSKELSQVKGFGPKKLELFGTGILDIIASLNGAESSSEQDSVPNDSEITTEIIDSASTSFSADSFVAPAPYSAPANEISAGDLDSFVAPAPYSAPQSYTGVPALDSYVAPAPFSFLDEDDDDDFFEEDDISEEIFGSASPTTTTDDNKRVKEEVTTTKLRKTQLKKDLKEYRLSQKEDGKPAYTVFTNAALDGIYAALPATMTELLEVKGIGPKKIELYGDGILEIVAPYAAMDGKKVGGNESNDSSGPIRKEKIDEESLTPEQRKAADMIFGRDQDDVFEHRPNVFITGQAGTGKSHLLRYVVETLQGKSHLTVGVCAPTGVAAVIVGGSTLHSFFGIGLGTGTKSNLLKKVRQNQPAKTRIDETDVLIIDECSMLSAELLETLDMVARNIRRDGMFSDEPFGGMQVIAFGDFFQLPPVHRYDGERDRSWRPFCFDSPVWSELGLSENIIELREVQRQDEGDFIDLLNKVRTGNVEPKDIYDLNQKCLVGPNNPLPNDGIIPTRLYVLNRDVDSENSMRLEELSGKEVVCTARDVWKQKMPLGTPASVKKKMKEGMSMLMPDEVKLKVGAQVMLTRNKDTERNLVNGSRGVVERFEISREGNPVPVVRFDSGLTIRVDPVEFPRYNPDGGEGCLMRMQVPLKLAWAVTIHKSQGSTLTRASLDITSAFEYGQCYVALSRVRSLDGLWLERPADIRDVMVSPQVLDFFSRS